MLRAQTPAAPWPLAAHGPLLLRSARLPGPQPAENSSLFASPVGPSLLQAAEERAIAGKCGNPLCGHAPAPAPAPPGGRFRTSTSQQSVFEHPDEEAPVFCGADCAAAVRRFAQRLGSGALALDRFCALYEQAQAEKPAQPPAAPAQQQPAEPAAAQQAAAQHSAAAAAGVQAPAAVQPASSGAGGAGRDGAGPPATDTCPGGIKSSTTLVPRLAVEQVEVKLIDSSAGQFADFSRNTWQAPPWQAPAARPAAPPLTRAAPRQPKPQPRGVLKKQSQFAAGTAKVPIMLAEVKVRGLRVMMRCSVVMVWGGGAGRLGAALHAGLLPLPRHGLAPPP